MKNFHAHIYFEPECLEEAHFLVERIRQMNLFEFVKLHEKPVGPHPTAMIEGHFSEASSVAVLEWIESHRQSFSVLIHVDTGDDFKDHTDGIRWLGKELKLNFEFFELIQRDPKLRIHS